MDDEVFSQFNGPVTGPVDRMRPLKGSMEVLEILNAELVYLTDDRGAVYSVTAIGRN